MATATLEERLTAVEKELAELRARRDAGERPGVIGRTRPDFVDQFFGIFAEDETAERVFRNIAAAREREREEMLTGEARKDRPGITGWTHPDFLKRFVGIHSSALGQEVLDEIAAEREREREEADRAADEEGIK